MYWKIIFAIAIIVASFALYNYKEIQSWLQTQIQENYNDDSITFLSKNELENILISDNDNFYSRFFKTDFEVRKINNISEYTSKIKNSVTDFTENEKKYISEIITSINDKFENVNLPWLNGKKFNQIKWKLGLVSGYDYENGLCHTRNDTIIIQRDKLNHISLTHNES